MLKRLFIGALCTTLYACGGGGGGGNDADTAQVDNSANSASISRDIGYAGGNVVFGGQRIVGEWSTTQTLSKSGGKDAFKSTDNFAILSVKFDEIGYSEYWSQFIVSAGKVVSNAAWTPVGVYGVSKDGATLVVDKYSSVHTFTVKSTHTDSNGKACVLVLEPATGDEYDLCKVS